MRYIVVYHPWNGDRGDFLVVDTNGSFTYGVIGVVAECQDQGRANAIRDKLNAG
jgi:hypothetical protein